MKRILPVEELARDERFERMRIEDLVFDPRNARPSERASARNGFTPDERRRARRRPRLMHGIFVGEIQALEGAGRTCWDFDTGTGARRGAVRAQARHGPPVLGRGPPRRDLRASSPSTWVRRSASSPSRRCSTRRPATPTRCCASPASTAPSRASPSTCSTRCASFGEATGDPVLYFCEDWMLADEVTHVKMGSDWLRRLTANDPERQKNALDFQRTVDKLFSFGGFRGEEEENPIHLARTLPLAGRLLRRRDRRPRRRRRRGLARRRRPHVRP